MGPNAAESPKLVYVDPCDDPMITIDSMRDTGRNRKQHNLNLPIKFRVIVNTIIIGRMSAFLDLPISFGYLLLT